MIYLKCLSSANTSNKPNGMKLNFILQVILPEQNKIQEKVTTFFNR